jgi:aminoglycoside 6'-N-acetyltransferase
LAEIKQIAADPAFDCYIVSIDGREVGYLQSYDPQTWPDHPFTDRPCGSCGLDMFIGEPDMIGQGYGTQIVQAFADRLFAAGVPEVLIDPHPDNAAAIKAYGRAGFIVYGERDTEWGRVLLMRQANPALSGNRAT